MEYDVVIEKKDGSFNGRRLESPYIKEDMLRLQLQIASEKF